MEGGSSDSGLPRSERTVRLEREKKDSGKEDGVRRLLAKKSCTGTPPCLPSVRRLGMEEEVAAKWSRATMLARSPMEDGIVFKLRPLNVVIGCHSLGHGGGIPEFQFARSVVHAVADSRFEGVLGALLILEDIESRGRSGGV
jgi:hypothetical protein